MNLRAQISNQTCQKTPRDGLELAHDPSVQLGYFDNSPGIMKLRQVCGGNVEIASLRFWTTVCVC